MWQFSLRSLMGVTLAILFFTWVFGVLPGWVGGVLLLAVHSVVPSATLAGLLYMPGNYRAFFVGVAPIAIVCLLIAFVMALDDGPDFFFDMLEDRNVEERFALCGPLALMFVSGWVAVGARIWGVRLKEAAAAKTLPAKAPADSLATNAVPAAVEPGSAALA